MTDNQLVNWLTAGGGLPLLVFLFSIFVWAMKRADENRDRERKADEQEAAAAALLKQRYLVFRDQFQGLINRCIRRLENIRNKADQGDRDAEIIRAAEDAIAELERIELPPLE